jgi:hypothetical protein
MTTDAAPRGLPPGFVPDGRGGYTFVPPGRTPDQHCAAGWYALAGGNAGAAAGHFRRALAAEPDSADGHHGLGKAMLELSNLPGALAELDEAVRLGHPHWSPLARSLGTRGPARARRGVRGLLGKACRRWPDPPGTPAWDGSPLAGRTLLLLDDPDMGLGDIIQAAGFAAGLRARGTGRVIARVRPSVRRLLATCPALDAVEPDGPPWPPHDVHLYLRALPVVLHANPPAGPYLFAEPEAVEAWRLALADVTGFKVGIVWHGGTYPAWRGRDLRAAPLHHFGALAALPGVRLISLQRDGTPELPCEKEGGWGRQVRDLGPRLDRGADAFVSTAAVMRNLDLVVTTDTSSAHVAGALGVPTFVLLAWHWSRRFETPPYPGMVLYRMANFGGWDATFAAVAKGVAALARGEPLPLAWPRAAGYC